MQTPMVAGQLEVVRYFRYCDRALDLVKQHIRSRPLTDSLGELTVEARLRECRNIHDLYALCGHSDFWVSTSCASLKSRAKTLDGTQIALQKRDPDGYDFTIRTPCTPDRWREYDAEMREAWLVAARRAAEVRRDTSARRFAVDAALVCFYYFVNFGALSRGTATTAYAVLVGTLLAFGFRPPLPPFPPNFQLDWEALLRTSPQDFLKNATRWLTRPLLDDENPTRFDPDDGFIAELPSVELAFPTLADRLAVLLC